MGTIPTLSTVSAGAVATAAMFNAVKDAFDFIKAPPQCSAYAGATQTLTTAVAAAIALNSELFDVVQSGDSPSHDLVTNNSRLVCRTSGKYEMTGQVRFNGASAVGVRTVALRLNGTTDLITNQQPAVGGGSSTDVAVPVIVVALTAGDFIEMRATQTSGGNLDTVAGQDKTFLRFAFKAS